MRRYPPSTTHRYLDLPSTQRFQTHNSPRHNTTPPDPGPSHPTTPHPHHRNQNTDTSNTPPVPPGLVKPKPNPLIHSPPYPPTPPRAKHIHISHSPPTPHIPRTTLIHNTSAALDIIPEPCVTPTCPALTTPHPSPTPALPSTSHHHTLSTDTHATQTTVHASQSQQPPHPHRVARQPHRQTKYHMTTDTTQGHIPSSKSERNLIILQVNINGIKNKLEELNLLIHDTHVDIITIQETKLTPKAKTPKVHNFRTVGIDRLHKAGSLHSLETTLLSLQQTYLRPSIHTTQNFKWSRYT